MTPEMMRDAAKKSKALCWTDAELDQQIETLELVLPYLEERGKTQDTVYILYIELESFKRMRSDRQEEKRRAR